MAAKLVAVIYFFFLGMLCCQGFPEYAKVQPMKGMAAYRVASMLLNARTMVVNPSNGDILVLTRGGPDKVTLVRLDAAGTAATVFPILTTPIPLTHGMALHKGWLYVSDNTTVYRWQYTSGSTSKLDPLAYQIAVKHINENGKGGAPLGHLTRTVVIDSNDMMYVSVGSVGNLDPNSFRARIRHFDISADIPAGGFEFLNDGNVFADGLRNQVGLGFDLQGRLWGTETGIDNIERPDLGLGTNLFENNPAEELNLFDGPLGEYYGYPDCFSSYKLGSYPIGTQFAVYEALSRGITDAWCRNQANNRRPELYLPDHSSPLGVTFYTGQGCTNKNAIPCSWTGDAFVALHGSWDRTIPAGYQVVHIPMSKTTGLPVGTWETIAQQVNYTVACAGSKSAGCWRPVNVQFLLDGRMIISSDASSDITLLEYHGTATPSPSPPPSPRPPPRSPPRPSPPPRPRPPPPTPLDAGVSCPPLAPFSGTRVAAVNSYGPQICGYNTVPSLVGLWTGSHVTGWESNVYASQHYGRDFSYVLPVTAGSTYRLRFHFAEIYWTASGKRLFNVLLGASNPTLSTPPALTNVDVYALAGAKNVGVRLTADYTAPAGSSQLFVRFVYVKDNACVSALELFRL